MENVSSAFQKFAFEEEFAGRKLTPKQEREQTFAEGKAAGEQEAQRRYEQKLQTELAQRDQKVAQAVEALANARIEFEAGLQEQTLDLVTQLLKQVFGNLTENVPDKLLQEHLPQLLAHASSATGGTLLVHEASLASLQKAVPSKSGYVVEAAAYLQPGQLEIQFQSGTAILDLPDFVHNLCQCLQTGKALAKQKKNSKVTKAPKSVQKSEG